MSARVSIGRGVSHQEYATPRDFVEAVRKRLGITNFSWDLAASSDNTVCPRYIDVATNSLTVDWNNLGQRDCWLWLNPPFADIAPWARKCAEESDKGARIVFLVPASVGSNWYAQYVHGKSLVLFIRPRLSFDGNNPYPKDCILAIYGMAAGFECWDWRKSGWRYD